MGLGMAIGSIAGLLFFDNVGAGIGIGLCFGVALGTSLDARTSRSSAAGKAKTKKK
ncbi:glycine zipper family protein [bacterium]|nr:MAG: glycine zipper family protein [bacterium]